MNKLLIISTLIVLTSCGQSTQTDQKNQVDKEENISTEIELTKTENKTNTVEKSLSFECSNFDFDSAKEQSDSILVFIERATISDSTNRQKWEQKFFCVFPNSFDRMQEVFGYDNDKGAAPLYDYPNGENVIQYFSQLESVPDSIYYDKYVKININGVWEADNIREAFDFGNRLFNDTKNACKILSRFSDTEIKSVFRFIFDGPHPRNEHNERIYKGLSSKIDNQDKRLSKLLTQAYEKLMNEDDGHGH